MKHWVNTARLYLGIESGSTTHLEKAVSGLGAFVGVYLVYVNAGWTFGQGLAGNIATLLVVGSMGATAVLLFAVPHGVLSQPWAVLGGHLVSAFIGVSCHRYVPAGYFMPALAVGLSVLVMYYLRCIHPPGGATALTAVVGGNQITDLGYAYLFNPILLNVAAILLVAFAFNFAFRWRRYPAHMARRRHLPVVRQSERVHELTHEDFSAAIQSVDSFIDISAEDLAELLERAKFHAETNAEHPAKIVEGKCYSNGKIGNLWSIRQVIDAANHPDPAKDKVIYKVLAGAGNYATDMCNRDEFRLWTRFEVVQKGAHWIKLVDE
ncbi:HPP family protein [Marinobacterium sedimentorum]|uniref:HPP family protein n=1 Tax=Marinobacterium sedimentorum TaxID=2927804 RepID=UPI0020C5F27A|nr:HPP family protein [Marinobacterium sedimentorum]